MAYPLNALDVIAFLVGAAPRPEGRDFDAELLPDKSGIEIAGWAHASSLPSEAEVAAAAADQTSVGGKTFSQWLAENGGDAAQTTRRAAGELIDASNDRGAVLRAALLVVMDEINLLRAQHGLSARTAAQLVAAVKKKISDGDAD